MIWDKKTHEHEYIEHPNQMDWKGSLVCKICGFRVPSNLRENPAVKERTVSKLTTKG